MKPSDLVAFLPSELKILTISPERKKNGERTKRRKREMNCDSLLIMLDLSLGFFFNETL
jgi:hypothetical protein